jgi:mannose-1-phosphate guanylyltransferase
MDHIWNDLKNWESIWEEHLGDEKNGHDHEYKQQNIELLTNQLISIRKEMKEIGKWV